ncbi:MAG: ribonuclease H family protein [Bacteroidales bacterium]|jgi:ribonuclease HI
MAEKKYYVVWKGLKTGIFDTWEECREQVKGVDGAVYKAFKMETEAREAFTSDWKEYIGRRIAKAHIGNRAAGRPELNSLSVDAACSGNPGVLEYRGVETATGRQLFHQGPFPLGTVNIGEFLAIVHALAYLKKHKQGMPVYSDSKTAIKWLKDQAIKTKLPRNKKTGPLFELVDRAIHWLKENHYPNQVLKWETKDWGEIPADFGRK